MGTLAFCQLCGQRIAEKSQLFRHPDWLEDTVLRICPACARDAPRCDLCGLPISPGSPVKMCVTCLKKQPVCLGCGRAVSDANLFFDGAGPYCQRCCQDRQPCDSCRAPLTDERWQLSDGRLICSFCCTGAIFSPQEAVDLFAEVQSRLARELGIRLNIPTGVFLADQEQMRQVLRQQPIQPKRQALDNRVQGAPDVLGVYLRRGMKRGIYILTGLPRKLFIQTAAHEYAHAWQGENCPTLESELIQEGFAEWVAYRTLGIFGYTGGLAQMRDRHDIYGEGLRWALDREDRKGASAVISACRGEAAISQNETPEARIAR